MADKGQERHKTAVYALTLLENEAIFAAAGGREEEINFWSDSLKLFRDVHVDSETWQTYQSWTDTGIRKLMQIYGSTFGASLEDWKRRPKTEVEARENLAKLSTALDYIRVLAHE